MFFLDFLNKITEFQIPSNQLGSNNFLSESFSLCKQKVYVNGATEFSTKLRNGELSKEIYVRYIIDLYEVYSSLEISIQKRWENRLDFENGLEGGYESYFWFLNNPLLFRNEKLLKDLCSPDLLSIEIKNCSKIAREYSEYLLWLSTYHPHFLIAHAYVRYIEDLSDIEIAGQSVSRQWPTATHYYDFSELFMEANQTNQEFQSDFKSRLNIINFTDNQIADLMDECKIAYDFYLKLLAQAVTI